METLAGPVEYSDKHREVTVIGSELVENYTVYVIEVHTGVYNWKVKHRYSDFYDLHEKLTAENKVEWNLLPPKKIIGKNSKSLVEKRQKDLEVYLQELLSKFPVTVPRALSHFLHFHLYEIHGIAAVLAEELYHNGDQLLVAGEVFHMRPLQLYAISQLLRHGKPTCINGDAKTDLGHILDFICRLKYLKISGSKGPVGTSNIQEHLLSYDLSVFKSLCQVEICHSNARLIKGFTSCKKTLETMTVQFSASSMKDILVPEAFEFDHWEAEGATSDCPITAVVPKWSTLTTVDMSHNQMSCIDDSVKIVPQIEFLALSHNTISSIENLQHLYNLTHLDLSYNKLSRLESIHSKIGNIKTLNLAGNLLESLRGLNKLYSLVNLDLGNNKISQVEEIKTIGNLPCLETVILTDNPVTIIPDYRTKILAQFGDRAAEVCLDNTATTGKELDTVEVLKAIQKAKEAKDKLNNNDKKKKGGIQHSVHDRENREPSKSDTVFQNDDKNLHVLSRITLEEESTTDLHCSVFPIPCISNPDTDQDFIPYFCTSIAHALKWNQHLEGKVETRNNPRGDSSEPVDGYFEMGLHEEDHSVEWNLSERNPSRSQDTNISIVQILWNFSVHLQGHNNVKSFSSCLVLTDALIALFEVHGEVPEESHNYLPSLLKLVCYFYYADVTEFSVLIPETCLALNLRNGEEYIVIVTNTQNLEEFSSCLHEHCTLPSVDSSTFEAGLQSFFQHLVEEHKMNLADCGIKGLFPVCLYYFDDLFQRNTKGDLCEKISGDTDSSSVPFCIVKLGSNDNIDHALPVWLFFTQQDMIMVQIDFHMVSRNKKLSDCFQNIFSLSRVSLASIVVHPLCWSAEEKWSLQENHILQLIWDSICANVFFVFPQDKCRFLSLYKLLRTSLHEFKNIVILKALMNMKSTKGNLLETKKTYLQAVGNIKPSMTLPATYPSESIHHKLSEENQIPFHLPACEPLQFIAALTGKSIVEFFHNSISEDENEELRHLMWSSLSFYPMPDVEVTSCVLLSTKAVYFVLDDTIKKMDHIPLNSHNQNNVRSEQSFFHYCCCLVITFSDLQSVNIGLFDQFFRVTGPSPSHIVTCLTRDSYTTHAFIQQLMSVLSLMSRTPSPEPVEKDFYSEFGNKRTGTMENYEMIHSSRVKFIYPNEEEIGDLTYIVTERTGSSGTMQSLNILLYVLAFQVSAAEGTEKEALLQPKTLILTNSDLFLFNEDYISYPLPDFAKEPPKKDKYQLVDGRRIRDLDRVLMGYQTYPQTLTFLFDDSSNQDLMHSLSVDHFAEPLSPCNVQKTCANIQEVQWYIFIPSADCREKLISLLARQWEILCGRELPLELTG
ncbi:nischarin isoform 2-T2 [Mantella aurantiaca]